MFFLSLVWRNIWRNKVRGLLTVGIVMFLLLFVGVYLGNEEKNQSALDKLSDTVPVDVQVTNADGSQNIGLEINTKRVDSLLSQGIRNPVYTAQAAGNLELINRVKHVKVCDTRIVGANDLAAFASVSQKTVKLMQGRNVSFLAGKEPVCIVSESYAARHHVAVGNMLMFPLYITHYNSDGSSFQFVSLGQAKLTVIGLFRDEASETGAVKDLIVPVSWLRSFAEKAGETFYYDSFRCAIKNPMQLNVFKADMENLLFTEIKPDASDKHSGESLVIQDKVFIENATKLSQNITLLRRFQFPIFLMVVLLLMLVMFLLMRSRRREIAVASSLGQKKIVSAAELFVENIILVFVGCILAVPILVIGIGTSLQEAVMICLLFLGCSCLGIWAALFMLLRFDTLSLLTKLD